MKKTYEEEFVNKITFAFKRNIRLEPLKKMEFLPGDNFTICFNKEDAESLVRLDVGDRLDELQDGWISEDIYEPVVVANKKYDFWGYKLKNEETRVFYLYENGTC